MLRPSLFVPAVFVTLAAPAATIESSYDKGITIEVTSTTTEEVVFDDIQILINDQPMDVPEEQKQIPDDQTTVTTVAYEDVVLAVDGGRRTKIERTFTEMEETGGGEDDEDKVGALLDKTLTISLDDEGEIVIELEDDDVEDVYLADHRIDFELESYFPEEEVEIGDTWQVEGEALERLMEEGPRLFEIEDVEAEFAELSQEGMEYEAEVTYARNEEVDGRECAVLEVAFEFSTSADDFDPLLVGFDPEEMGMGEAEVLTDYMLNAEGESQVWIDLKTGRPVSEEESVEASVEVVFKVANEGFELQIVSDVTLTVTTSTTFTEGDGE